MKYTREQIIKSIETLRSYCIDTRCENCEFSVNNKKCKLDGLPANWCIPARYPSKKKLVPFDLSLKEDRDAVIGKRIYSELLKDDRIISRIFCSFGDWYADNISSSELFKKDYVFADTGKPVGKEIDE